MTRLFMYISLADLMEYTDWERSKWHDWLRQQGDHVLKISLGPHGNGRFATIGDWVRHIFSSEKRYVERLSGIALTDTTSIPSDNVEALFELAQKSRKQLRQLLATFPDSAWNAPRQLKLLNYLVTVTPKKTVTHILIHEMRHWAQIATLFRLNGLVVELHDFLASPVMGGQWRSE